MRSNLYSGPNKNQRKEQEPIPEPPHEINSTTDQVLYASAFADYCTYECASTRIDFKPTLMYQSRVFKITVKNTGKVSVKYSFLLFDEEGAAVSPDSKDCPFAADPPLGVIEVNDSLTALVRFSPNDEATYTDYHLVFMAPNLAKEMVPLNISLSGRSVRPFCHFELEESDYIASERTTPELTVQNGTPMVLEAGTKVIEFNSCGIKVRNVRKFYIVNPTSIAWEFMWACVSGNDQMMFRCLTTRGVVQPGKKFEIAFEFMPDSVDLRVFYLII
jgi:hydrocephalus-inducing protein